MSTNHFFAMMSRMKYINRWGLMNNTRTENISEHSLEVAMLAHVLVTIHNKKFGGSLNPERAALLGIYHDTTEILTGDMPTPIKYYNLEIKEAYKQIEKYSANKLVAMLPDYLQEEYQPLLNPLESEKELWRFVKAADKLSALIKCMEEMRNGNSEFSKAEQAIIESLDNMDMPELNQFTKDFMLSYSLTLDEQE